MARCKNEATDRNKNVNGYPSATPKTIDTGYPADSIFSIFFISIRSTSTCLRKGEHAQWL